MSSKTKIVVLHMKEVIYTGIFLLLLCDFRCGDVPYVWFRQIKNGIFRCRFQNIRPESTALLSD